MNVICFKCTLQCTVPIYELLLFAGSAIELQAPGVEHDQLSYIMNLACRLSKFKHTLQLVTIRSLHFK